MVVDVTSSERAALERLVRAASTPQKIAVRARIVLLAAHGVAGRQIAKTLGVSEPTVGLWRQSFAERRHNGLAD